MTSVFEFSAVSLAGQPVELAQYHDKVLLIVNTASACGFTPQYTGLEKLHERFGPQGFAVLGFPCNQFGAQEPGTAEEIGAFCETKYAVTFPLFAKIDVNGAAAHPLYQYLKKSAPGVLGTEAIKWNFTKFLVRRDGTVAHRYGPMTKPEEIAHDIETLLQGAAG
jgi:glutathione peroxidase